MYPRCLPAVRSSGARTSGRAGHSPTSGRSSPPTSASARSLIARASWRTSLSTIREGLEHRERKTLAPQAAKSADTTGRLKPERQDDVKPAYKHDPDRII